MYSVMGADRLLRSRRTLLDLVNAAPEVQAQALPFLRIMFVFSIGMLMFFMLSGGAARRGRRPHAAAARRRR